MTDIIEVPPACSERETTTDYRGERATYACTTCGYEKAVGERPHADGPRIIQTGCPECETMRRFRWRADPYYIARLAGDGA